MASRRALHFVFKVGDRHTTTTFYREILGMKFCRHEEFDEACKATCNGPYDGKWSKSMVGYGAEDSHFVVELTYNYGLGSYKLGNDFLGLTIHSKAAVASVVVHGWTCIEDNGTFEVRAPGGYTFFLRDEDVDGDPVQKVSLATSNLDRSLAYWRDLLQMTLYDRSKSEAILGYAENQCKLELKEIEGPVDHGSAFGRIAFSCPREQLAGIEASVREGGHRVLTPLISLDTPGKATVEVVILADPDGHEICFVGDEAFRELSQVDPAADDRLNEALEEDKSDDWFASKGKVKGTV